MGMSASGPHSTGLFQDCDWVMVHTLILNQRFRDLMQLKQMFRIADDIGAINGPYIFSLLNEFGPTITQHNPTTQTTDTIPCLKLNHENSSTPHTMVFCDARFEITNGHITYKPFDKAEDIPTLANKLLRYVHVTSASTPHSLTSIVLGQLQRLASVSDTAQCFTWAAAHFILQVICRGHSRHALVRITKNFTLPQLPYITWDTKDMTKPLSLIIFDADNMKNHPHMNSEHIGGVRTPHTEALLDILTSPPGASIPTQIDSYLSQQNPTHTNP